MVDSVKIPPATPGAREINTNIWDAQGKVIACDEEGNVLWLRVEAGPKLKAQLDRIESSQKPRQPTEAMLAAGREVLMISDDANAVWIAMYDAEEKSNAITSPSQTETRK